MADDPDRPPITQPSEGIGEYWLDRAARDRAADVRRPDTGSPLPHPSGSWSALDGKPIWSPAPGPGEPGYSQDIRRDIASAIDQAGEPAPKKDLPLSEPPPAAGHDALPRNWIEAVPTILFGFYGFAFAFEAVVAMNEGHATLFLLDSVGCLICAGIAIAWWNRKDWLPQRLVMTVTAVTTDARWLVGAFTALLIVSALSPFVEQKRWPLSAWGNTETEIAKSVKAAIDPIKAELTSARKERDAAQAKIKEFENSALPALSNPLSSALSPSGQGLPSPFPKLKSLGDIAAEVCPNGTCPPTLGAEPISAFQTAKEHELQKSLDDKSKELEGATKQRDVALGELKRLREPKTPPVQTGPVTWNLDSQFLITSYDTPGNVVNGIILQGTSNSVVGIKEAYAVSGMTGHRQEFMVSVPDKGYYPVNKVDVPPQAPIMLGIDWKPPLLIRDFIDQWSKLKIVIVYSDGTTYEHSFDENYVLLKLKAMVPNAFGPRVTPKDDK